NDIFLIRRHVPERGIASEIRFDAGIASDGNPGCARSFNQCNRVSQWLAKRGAVWMYHNASGQPRIHLSGIATVAVATLQLTIGVIPCEIQHTAVSVPRSATRRHLLLDIPA